MPLNVNPIIAQLIAAQGANGAQPQSQGQGMGFKPAAQPQRRGGLLSRLRSVVTPERLQIFGATLRDIDTGGNSLDEVLQQIEAQRQQEIQNTWQDEGRLRQRMEWKQSDERAARLGEWAATQGPEAQVDPAGAFQAFRVANTPLTVDQRNDNTRQDRSLEETMRHNRIAETLSRNAVRASSDPNQFHILTAAEVAAQGLARGSYQRNLRTGQITPIGRQRAQYTDSASLSAQFADRTRAAHQTLTQLENSLTNPAGVYAAGSGAGTQAERQVRQAQREFVNAILRRESGAAIAPSEFTSAAQQYFPQPGDGPRVLAQKRAARQRTIQGLINSSQGAYEEWYGGGAQGGPVDDGGDIVIDADGNIAQ